MSLRFIFLILLLLPSVCDAQEGIFAPFKGVNPQPEAAVGDPMARLVALQAGLEDVIYAFDAQAKHVASQTHEFEAWVLKNHERRFLNPEEPAPRMTFSEQARYDLFTREPTLCFSLDEALKTYIAAHSQALSEVVNALLVQTSSLDDAARGVFADKLQTSLAAARPHKTRVQEILYQCLYKNKNALGMPREYSVEKTMRSWFLIQQPLLDAWLGNVD